MSVTLSKLQFAQPGGQPAIKIAKTELSCSTTMKWPTVSFAGIIHFAVLSWLWCLCEIYQRRYNDTRKVQCSQRSSRWYCMLTLKLPMATSWFLGALTCMMCSLVSSNSIHIFPCGVLHVITSGYLCEQRVYQSALQQSIVINGSGFADGMILTIEPPLTVDRDYSLEVVNESVVYLHLLDGEKWRYEHGPLMIKSASLDGETSIMARNGAYVALVHDDPVIVTPLAPKLYYETHSKRIDLNVEKFPLLYPQSFSYVYQYYGPVTVTLSPTVLGHFTAKCNPIGSLLTITLNRNSDQGWLPPNMSLQNDTEGEHKQVPLFLTSINTGAGDISIAPHLVGYVIRDRQGVVCTDTCKTAFNGRCEDGSLRGIFGGAGNTCDLGTDCEDCSMQRKLTRFEYPVCDGHPDEKDEYWCDPNEDDD